MKPYLPHLVLGIGIVCLVVSGCLCSFVLDNDYLGDPTCQRVLSFLADHGYFDTGRPGLRATTSLYRSPTTGDGTLMVHDVRRAFICTVLILRDPAQRVTAAPEYQQLEEVRVLWASFDRQRYPINPRVVRAALLSNASRNPGWASAYSVHGHFGLPFEILNGLAWVGLRVSLPFLGPESVLSLCRLGIPLWLSCVVTAAGMVWHRRTRHRG